MHIQAWSFRCVCLSTLHTHSHILTHTLTYHTVIMSRRRRAHSISSMPFILFSVAIRSRLSGVYFKLHMIRSE